MTDQDAVLHTDVQFVYMQTAGEKIPMVTALELGPVKEADPARPSVIVRRMEQGGLWQLAKKCGSSCDLIRQANALTEEPPVGKMLIIPVL